MDKLIQTRQLTFTYPDASLPVLQGVDLTINRGEFIVIAGATGSGKTTLINHFKKELLPNGQRSGKVLIKQQAITDLSKLASAKTIGYVGQDPTTQPIMTTVIDELAFGLENIGIKSAEIERRIAELANYLGLDELLHQDMHELSGGQLQLVNLASVLILRPEVLLFDEPTAQLDPLSSRHFFDVLERIHQELGMTIVMTEHNLGTTLGLANRMILLQNQRVTFQGQPAVGIPKMMADPDLAAISKYHLEFTAHTDQPKVVESSTTILSAKEISFSFDKQVNVVDHLNLQLPAGDWLSIVGKNGSGKSTLLTMLAGLRVPQHGKITFNNQKVWRISTAARIQQLSFLSQTPALQFGAETVQEELHQQAAELQLEFPDKQVKMIVDRLNRKYDFLPTKIH